MPSPTLADLPPPPRGKTGWPWTVETPPLPHVQPNGAPWPRISIVTPSYNQGQFLEETIRSVLLQGYPNLEYIIIDGGSTDDTIEIIRKYEPHLAYWISEKDRGQSHAINKGLSRIEADVWAYLNSDDFYMPGTFVKVMEAFADPSVEWVTGIGRYINAEGATVKDMVPVRDWTVLDVVRDLIPNPVMASSQVSNFMRSTILKKHGHFREDFHYCMDAEFGLRIMMDGVRPVIADGVLAKARLHPTSKTVSMAPGGAFDAEKAKILRELLDGSNVTPELASAAKKALSAHQKLSAISDVRRVWDAKGAISGLWKLTHSFLAHPDLLTYRPALGLARRMIFERKA